MTAPRLYLVTPRRFEPEALAVTLDRVLATHGVACLRLDLGPADEAAWRGAANALIGVCHAHDVALVIAEHARLVVPLGLDGVHLGAGGPVRKLRRELGAERIIGAFGGTSRHAGMELAEAGADYVCLGPVASGDAAAELAPDDLFAWWAEMIETPVVAEGGVGVAEAARLAATADFVVPDAAFWDAPDPVAALGAFAAALA